jgi:hypothetical protein
MTRLIILLLTLLYLVSCKGQTQAVESKVKTNSSNQYKDFVVSGDSLWALTTDGKLALFNANNGNPIANAPKNNAPVTILTSDRSGDIIIGDKKNSIKKYNKTTHSWITLYNFTNTLLGICFDSNNNCYLITGKGIYDPVSYKYYYPDSSQNYQIRHAAGWIRQPVYLTDKNNNIWIGFGYGEWGGELFIYNTTGKKFIVPGLTGFPITLNPIKSIFETNENVFVTAGLMHFFTRGSIVKFDNFTAQPVFESEEHKKFPDDSTDNEMIAGEYIGPGAFNNKDGYIYFYSQHGIFKGNPKTDLSNIENWEKLFQPKLHWTNGQADAIGSPMNVLKLSFTNSGKLVFVSQNDGIGIYDGNTLILTR